MPGKIGPDRIEWRGSRVCDKHHAHDLPTMIKDYMISWGDMYSHHVISVDGQPISVAVKSIS